MLEVQRNGLLRNRIGKLLTRDFLAISDEIANSTSLQELEVDRFAIKDLPALGKCVKGHPTLRKLAVVSDGCVPRDERTMEFTSLFLADISNNVLTSLRLDGVVFPDVHYKILSDYLEMPACTLRELFLRNLRYIGRGTNDDLVFNLNTDALVHGLLTNTSLHTLYIGQQGLLCITVEDLNALTQLFKVNKTITSFHMDTRYLRCESNYEQARIAYEEFTNALAESSVTNLSLSFSQQSHVFSEVRFSKELQVLKLPDFPNALWPTQMLTSNLKNICDLMLSSENFYALEFADHYLDSNYVKMIADALSLNPALSSLSLRLKPPDYETLAKSLATNTSLTHLYLPTRIGARIPEDTYREMALDFVARNRAKCFTLFDQLYHHALDVNDSDYDENGYFTKKHVIPYEPSSSKRHHT